MADTPSTQNRHTVQVQVDQGNGGIKWHSKAMLTLIVYGGVAFLALLGFFWFFYPTQTKDAVTFFGMLLFAAAVFRVGYWMYEIHANSVRQKKHFEAQHGWTLRAKGFGDGALYFDPEDESLKAANFGPHHETVNRQFLPPPPPQVVDSVHKPPPGIDIVAGNGDWER